MRKNLRDDQEKEAGPGKGNNSHTLRTHRLGRLELATWKLRGSGTKFTSMKEGGHHQGMGAAFAWWSLKTCEKCKPISPLNHTKLST